MSISEKFCLKWDDFLKNIKTSLEEQRTVTDFGDVTLACDGDKQIEAHRVILSASSPFFSRILKQNKHQHPIVYLKGYKGDILEAIVGFIYSGEVNIYQEDLTDFLALAEDMELKGLSGVRETATEPVKYPEVEKTVITPMSAISSTKTNTTIPINHKGNEYETYMDTVNVFEDDKGEATALLPFDSYYGRDIKLTLSAAEKIGKIVQNINGIWTCTVCGHVSKRNFRTHVAEHAEIHIEGASYPCVICGRTFRSTSSCRSHYYKEHKDLVKPVRKASNMYVKYE